MPETVTELKNDLASCVPADPWAKDRALRRRNLVCGRRLDEAFVCELDAAVLQTLLGAVERAGESVLIVVQYVGCDRRGPRISVQAPLPVRVDRAEVWHARRKEPHHE